MPSKAEELRNLLNTTMKTDMGRLASDEVYKSGYWSTSILPIDAALGGGWAKARMGLISGESATLKSLIGLGTVVSVQRAGGTAVYIDLEHSFNQEWAAKIGIDNDNLVLIQPKSGEEAIDAAEVFVRNDVDYICFDSIAAMLPRNERELMLSGKDNNQPANTARLMSLGLRKLNSANEKTSLLWITQMRDNVGAMAFAPKTNATGGKAKHFYVSQELQLKKTGKVYSDIAYWTGQKDSTDKRIVQQEFRVELLKSRFGQPFKLEHFVFDLMDGVVDTNQFLIQKGLDLGVITKKGAWWNITLTDSDGVVTLEDKAGSKDKFKELVDTTEEVRQPLLELVCQRHNLDWRNYVLTPTNEGGN